MLSKNTIRNATKYCREPVENIKGYEEAISNPGKYVCHHLNELTFTRDELKKINMYYHRPSSELIFLSKGDHIKWHWKWNPKPYGDRAGENNSMYGKRGELSPHYGKIRERNYSWKGESAGIGTKYRRALKEYRRGNINDEELQYWRDMLQEYRKQRRTRE